MAGGSLMAGGWSSKKGATANEAKMFIVAEIHPAERLVTFRAAKVGGETSLAFAASLLFFPFLSLHFGDVLLCHLSRSRSSRVTSILGGGRVTTPPLPSVRSFVSCSHGQYGVPKVDPATVSRIAS